jgi:hypothetical protein
MFVLTCIGITVAEIAYSSARGLMNADEMTKRGRNNRLWHVMISRRKSLPDAAHRGEPGTKLPNGVGRLCGDPGLSILRQLRQTSGHCTSDQ